MHEWGFLTNQGLILVYIAKHSESTARQIATAINITEWTVHKIVGELEKQGYIDKRRVGRKNSYRVHANLNLRHETLRDIDVGHLLEALGWEGKRKGRQR
jgi:DNA-binding MarR family transcriptional regulator